MGIFEKHFRALGESILWMKSMIDSEGADYMVEYNIEETKTYIKDDGINFLGVGQDEFLSFSDAFLKWYRWKLGKKEKEVGASALQTKED